MANAVLKMNQSCLSFFSQDWSFFIQVHLVWSENSFFSSSVIQVFHYVCFVGMRRSWEGCVPDLSLLGAYVTYEICFLTHCSYRRPSLERTKNDNNHLRKKIKKIKNTTRKNTDMFLEDALNRHVIVTFQWIFYFYVEE